MLSLTVTCQICSWSLYQHCVRVWEGDLAELSFGRKWSKILKLPVFFILLIKSFTCISYQEPFCRPPGSCSDASLDFVSSCLTPRGGQKSLQDVLRSLCLPQWAAQRSLCWLFVRCRRQLDAREVSHHVLGSDAQISHKVPGFDAQDSLPRWLVKLPGLPLDQPLLPSRCSGWDACGQGETLSERIFIGDGSPIEDR